MTGAVIRPAPPAAAAALARLHAEAFASPWSAEALIALLRSPGVAGFVEDAFGGFALMRTAADEAEILTLAVVPSRRRSGLARALLSAAAAAAADDGAGRLFLEVADDNQPALALYASEGFTVAGRRPNYYARAGGPRVDALVLMRLLSRTA